VLTQQGITNARSSEEDHLKRFITILRGDYKSGKKILLFLTFGQQLYTHKEKLNNNQSAIQALKANERRHAVAKGIPYPTPAILDEI